MAGKDSRDYGYKAPEPKSGEAKDAANTPDERDTNNVPKTERVGAEDPNSEVLVQYADGSTETVTAGELAETHGDPMGGPTVADLNPAFAPSASAHAGAQDS